MRKLILCGILCGVLLTVCACRDKKAPVQQGPVTKSEPAKIESVKHVETKLPEPTPPAKQIVAATPEFFENAMQGNTQAVEKFLIDGVDANSQNPEQRSALMFAAFDGHISIVELLLTHGADINAKDNIGRGALMYAASGPNEPTVKLLIEKGAEVNTIDLHEAWTPLMFAAAEGQIEVVKTLLENNADWTLKDTDGDTASSFAQKNGHTNVVELIDSHIKIKAQK